MRGKFKIAIIAAIIALIFIFLTSICIWPPELLIEIVGDKIATTTSSSIGFGKIGKVFGGIVGKPTADFVVPAIIKNYTWYFCIPAILFVFLATIMTIFGIKDRKREKISK